MAKKLILFFVVTLFVFSCSEQDNSQNSNALELNKSINFERLRNSAIGIEKDGKIQIGVSNDKIMQTFREFSNKYNPELKPLSFEVIEIDSKNYLRFYSENNIVSTIALIKGVKNQYRTGGTVCETVACAESGGCIPEGLYCTRGTLPDNLPGGPKGDCKRITIGIDPNS